MKRWKLLSVLLDYPEGKVRIPGSGGAIPTGVITDLAGFFGSSNDLDHALRQVVAGAFEIPDGLLFRVHFETCSGGDGPVSGDFRCRVLAAADANSVPLAGVTCTVAGLPVGTSTTTTTTEPSSTTTSSTTTSTSTTSTTMLLSSLRQHRPVEVLERRREGADRRTKVTGDAGTSHAGRRLATNNNGDSTEGDRT